MEFIQSKYPGYRKSEFNKVILSKLNINDLAKLLDDFKSLEETVKYEKNTNKRSEYIGKEVIIKQNVIIKAPDDTKGLTGKITQHNPNTDLPFTIKFKQRIEGDFSWEYKFEEFEINEPVTVPLVILNFKFG